ncbi:hypothetical protein [Sabulicella rubraurantiaca]|uniref:hypothetical protein n=1 Tax=Sabulicella rubraurantiaca TaxID=2811429 RepID=UPI001A964D5C|nr:hypothetical protein [Sabulicella rubraurantiaca]
MVEDPGLEQVYESVELVRGMGDPTRGQFCIMSLVARLAGEGHTDRPRCASPVIRSLAILINDRMPSATRQRLKVFVPCIVGTSDGLDRMRAALLCRAVLEEIFPRAMSEATRERAVGRKQSYFWRLWTGRSKRVLVSQIAGAHSRLTAEEEQKIPFGLEERVGEATGHLITLCAADAPTASDEAWYWNKAIGLLDRLCDVGADDRALHPNPQPLVGLASILKTDRPEDASPRKPTAAPPYFGFLFR